MLSLLLCSFIGILLRRKIKKEKLNLASDQFKLEDVRKSLEEVKILTEQFKIDRDVKCHELMYHTHRIVCSGFNTEDSPWVMPRVPPEEVMRDVLPQSFQTFADNFNRMARWSKGQYYLTKALTILFYPCYWYYMDLVKKKKYRQLQRQLEEAREFNLINNYDCEDKDIITVKLSKNKDYTICYLDFFRYERADLRYFTLSSPFLMYLSG